MIKQTKNIFYCKELDVPSAMNNGSFVFTTDTCNIYIYPNGSKIDFNKVKKDKSGRKLWISISQSNTLDPFVKNSFENNIDSSYKITRSLEGVYFIDFEKEVFLNSKYSFFNSSSNSNDNSITVRLISSKRICIETFDEFNQNSDSVLKNTSFVFALK
tara:strand:+ start:70 stop:543 length:474 start_codon:yes stop_codon:yes gene_type:complete